MPNCFFSIKFLLLFLILFSLTGYAAEKNKVVYLSKEKLRCLYEQVENLLEEETDPVIVILTNNCHQNLTRKVEVDKDRILLPEFRLEVNAQNPTLKREDIIPITRLQLQCFQLKFEHLMKNRKEPIRVEFAESCIRDKTD